MRATFNQDTVLPIAEGPSTGLATRSDLISKRQRQRLPVVYCRLTVRATCLLIILFATQTAQAHTINYVLEKAPLQHVIWYYTKLGFQHILPQGVDHILFVTGLCLLSTRFKPILWQATAFTVAHSVTLALSMKNIIVVPSAIVEPVIALSIVFVAIENLVTNTLKPWRILIVFCFGLVHGMGFANALGQLGLPQNSYLTSLIMFNVGVELGQITVILLAFFLLGKWFGEKPYYRKVIVIPLSILIAAIACFWTIQRLF